MYIGVLGLYCFVLVDSLRMTKRTAVGYLSRIIFYDLYSLCILSSEFVVSIVNVRLCTVGWYQNVHRRMVPKCAP